jgi:TRAP-type uncharacterized transport system substrate-binding protein
VEVIDKQAIIIMRMELTCRAAAKFCTHPTWSTLKKLSTVHEMSTNIDASTFCLASIADAPEAAKEAESREAHPAAKAYNRENRNIYIKI